jgi:DNA-binding NarL/FixJ family response regulator
MKAKIRVAVIDDHPLFREGVVHILTTCPDFEVVAQGGSAKEAVEIAKTRDPDILVLDVSIPGDGIAALEEIVATVAEIKVMMLTVSVGEIDVVRALSLGARGYVVKGISGSELLQALHFICEGERYLSPSLGAKLLSDIGLGKMSSQEVVLGPLTTREGEVLSFLGQGLSNKEIGSRLRLSEKTVKHYMTSVLQKLRVRSRLEAALLLQNFPDRDRTNESPTREGARV